MDSDCSKDLVLVVSFPFEFSHCHLFRLNGSFCVGVSESVREGCELATNVLKIAPKLDQTRAKFGAQFWVHFPDPVLGTPSYFC